MKKILVPLISCILISGCGAKFIQTSDDAGGVTDERWGVVEYRNAGIGPVIDARKEDARNKMREYCLPQRYKVVGASEKQRLKTIMDTSSLGSRTLGSGINTSSVTPSIAGYQEESYVSWRFVCVD